MSKPVKPKVSQLPTSLFFAGWGSLAMLSLWLWMMGKTSMAMDWVLVGMGLLPLVPFFMNRSSVRAVSVPRVACRPFHQNQPGTLQVQVENQSSRFLGDLSVHAYDASQECDLPQGEGRVIPLALVKHSRGVFPYPPITLKTPFPFHLFFATKRFTPSGQYVVYPAIESGAPPWPEMAPSPRRVDRAGEEVVAFREYRNGDAMNTVDWKVSARNQQIIVRQFESPVRRNVMFSFEQVCHLGLEDAVSRLATWVVRAHGEGVDYGLDLEGEIIPIHHSPEHRHACLTALARFRQEAPL